MAQDTKYANMPWIFESKGIMARPANDRPPDQHFYLDMAGTFEREESALSSRYGSTIINRSPDGTPGGTNYELPAAPIMLTRMKALNFTSYRYAALETGDLYRRAGDFQGPYAPIASGLSGERFCSLVTTCFGSSKPFLFIYDKFNQLKDSGVGTPSRIGIFPPTRPVTAVEYAPKFLPIDTFQSSAGYGASGMTLIGIATVATVLGTAGTAVLDYTQYLDATNSFKNAPDGMVATSVTNPDGQLRLKFNTNGPLQTYDIFALSSTYSPADSFTFKAVSFTIASNTTGHIGKNIPMDLSSYQTEDLIVLVIQVDGAAAVQEIRVLFDVNGSGYSSSYYYKSIIPVSYQGSLSLPQVNNPADAVGNAVSERSIGINDLWNAGGWAQLQVVADALKGHILEDPSPADPNKGIQPSKFASGDGPWSVIFLRKGDFQPVGNAGTAGLDWANITGWRVQVTTNTQGSATVAFNGLYIQGTPTPSGIGTLAGPSSFGGIGYDFVYTYYNVNTRTESNGCPLPKFSVTQDNPGGVSTLVVLRQAIDLLMQYSPDPQTTHLRIYVRGGIFGNNFQYADKIPNVTGTGLVHYQYLLPDAARVQGDILSLVNDVPVTSSLQVPIDTTLTGPIGPPLNTNIPTLQTINVADVTANFVPTQKVVIGTPQNLEEVYVVTGGVGTFTGFVQLPHDTGEQLQVFSIPAQACHLAALAYGQTWLAGDPNNPHFLYYTPNGRPENCPPQNYIPVGSPSDPITAVINFRGALLARTFSTWYQIFPGRPPYAQSTGSKHGSPASFDWCITENEIWYQAWDGIRTFRGVDGVYRSLIIEWLYRNNPLTPLPLVDLDALGDVIGVFHNNTATFTYIHSTSVFNVHRHQIEFSTTYNRWRNDDRDTTVLYEETDTHILLYATVNPATGGWLIRQEDINKDYDDGGWVGGVLTQIPIHMSIQTPYLDQNLPNNQKQYNALTIDADTNGQDILVTLLFDDDDGSVLPIVVGTINGALRTKFNLKINNGLGQEAYRVSLKLTANVKVAPILYQADIDAAPLADQRSSLDSYWIKFGRDESKLVKQGYFDYTTADGNPVTVKLFADGNTIPYYTFTLPPNTNRAEVPTRKRFPPMKLRQIRVVMVSDGAFQLWQPLQVDEKPIIGGPKGYMASEIMGGTVA